MTSPPRASTPRRGASSGGSSSRCGEDGTTILLTTHYLDEAEHLADRIAIIADGKLVALDTPAGLRARAADSRVTWDEDGGSVGS